MYDETIIQENEDKKLNKYLAEQEEESLCDSRVNDCYDESMIVDACSRHVRNG